MWVSNKVRTKAHSHSQLAQVDLQLLSQPKGSHSVVLYLLGIREWSGERVEEYWVFCSVHVHLHPRENLAQQFEICLSIISTEFNLTHWQWVRTNRFLEDSNSSLSVNFVAPSLLCLVVDNLNRVTCKIVFWQEIHVKVVSVDCNVAVWLLWLHDVVRRKCNGLNR